VISALRLAQDRHVRCEYEVHRDKQRAFSSGRLKLLEMLTAPMANCQLTNRERRTAHAPPQKIVIRTLGRTTSAMSTIIGQTPE
jgi:hypothetical protein